MPLRFRNVDMKRIRYWVWHVRIDPIASNGLTKPSAVDVWQARGMDTQRFLQRLGKVSPDKLEEILLALAAVIEYS